MLTLFLMIIWFLVKLFVGILLMPFYAVYYILGGGRRKTNRYVVRGGWYW